MVLSDETDVSLFERSLMVVAPSVSASVLGTKLYGMSGGVLVLNKDALPKFQMTKGTANTDYGSSGNQTVVSIPGSVARSGSWLGRAGDLTNATLSSSNTYGWGIPAASATRVANVSGSTSKWAIFNYHTNDALADGFGADGPRVFFFGGSGAITSLTTAGKRFLEEAMLTADSF